MTICLVVVMFVVFSGATLTQTHTHKDLVNNPHLGLINGPPPLFVFPLKTTFFTIHLLSKRPDIY